MVGGESTSLAGWKDGRQWRVGTDANVAWVRESTGPGLAITSAIPPVFGVYATIVVPDRHGREPGPGGPVHDGHCVPSSTWQASRSGTGTVG